MSKYKVESHIPAPAGRPPKNTELAKAIRALKPGQSISLGSKKERHQAIAIARRTGLKATTAVDPENSSRFRIWRKLEDVSGLPAAA